MTPDERAGRRRYGQWAGNSRGTPEDVSRCVDSVRNMSIARGMVDKQCERKRGHGPNGEYCKQHAKRKKVSHD